MKYGQEGALLLRELADETLPKDSTRGMEIAEAGARLYSVMRALIGNRTVQDALAGIEKRPIPPAEFPLTKRDTHSNVGGMSLAMTKKKKDEGLPQSRRGARRNITFKNEFFDIADRHGIGDRNNPPGTWNLLVQEAVRLSLQDAGFIATFKKLVEARRLRIEKRKAREGTRRAR